MYSLPIKKVTVTIVTARSLNRRNDQPATVSLNGPSVGSLVISGGIGVLEVGDADQVLLGQGNYFDCPNSKNRKV